MAAPFLFLGKYKSPGCDTPIIIDSEETVPVWDFSKPQQSEIPLSEKSCI